jgi:isocitrate/isopropylmalate dehydrogenase
MVFSKPNGEPMAATHSPGCSAPDLPSLTVGRPVASILSSAMSVRWSAPITLALNSRLASARRTVTSPSPATTWALVST